MRILIFLVFVLSSRLVASGQETPLRPGPFPHLKGAKIGELVNFENDIDLNHCYPLVVGDTIVAWLAGAYAFDGRLFVQRCLEFVDPSYRQAPGSRHGGTNEWWEEARLSADGDVLLTTRLKLPGWSAFSSPSFCRASVAYWAFRGPVLVPTIYDLRAGAVRATRSLGVTALETDNTGVLPAASWDAKCSEASFDGARVERPLVKLKVSQRR